MSHTTRRNFIATTGAAAVGFAAGPVHADSQHPHDLIVDSDESLYVAQFDSKQTYPIKLERL